MVPGSDNDMVEWRRRWKAASVVALVVVGGALGSVVFLGARDRPADAAVSPRQLRNVVSVHVVDRIDKVSCTPGSAGAPGPGDGGDWCYFLDPGLDLTRADRVEVRRDDASGDYGVDVTLAPADRGTFAAWTARVAGRQIAVRVQGRVVQAPHLETPLGGDSLYVFALTEADARALVRQLWQ